MEILTSAFEIFKSDGTSVICKTNVPEPYCIQPVNIEDTPNVRMINRIITFFILSHIIH